MKRRSLPRRLKKFLGKRLSLFASTILPPLYYAYMTLVWRTSRIEHYAMNRIASARILHEGVIVALWHETVFFVSFAFQEFRASTLASQSDFGELVTRLLTLCRFEVFRGGSSKGKSRKKLVLSDLIRHMRETRDVAYGITVDGSRGPRHVLKSGVVAIARATGKPIYAVHIACRPRFRAPTWDGTQIPIPFGEIRIVNDGPILCPRDVTADQFQEIVRRTQALLDDVSRRAETWVETGRLPPPREPSGPDPTPAEHRVGPRILVPGELRTPVPRRNPVAP